jgi:hypothetical protein
VVLRFRCLRVHQTTPHHFLSSLVWPIWVLVSTFLTKPHTFYLHDQDF